PWRCTTRDGRRAAASCARIITSSVRPECFNKQPIYMEFLCGSSIYAVVMLSLPRWQTIGIIAVTVLAAVFALPNLLPASVLDHLPNWYQQSRINLGLDLRGGAHFLLEADLRSLMGERLTNLSDSLRGELRKEQVPVADIRVDGGRSLVITLRDESQRAKAI